MGEKMKKIDKSKMYNVLFVHCLDDEDTIQLEVLGKAFFKTRNWFSDLGYLVKHVDETN